MISPEQFASLLDNLTAFANVGYIGGSQEARSKLMAAYHDALYQNEPKAVPKTLGQIAYEADGSTNWDLQPIPLQIRYILMGRAVAASLGMPDATHGQIEP